MLDNGELKVRARELHSRMTAMEDSTFLPTGGVFLTLPSDRLRELTSNRTEITNEDAWRFYAQWHEAVHMAQLVTSPYVCLYAFRVATLAHQAFEGMQDAQLATLKEGYRAAASELETVVDGHRPWEILETHAVTQGLLWAMPDNVESLYWLANHLYTVYKDSPRYVRLLNEMAQTIGDDAAIRLLPRLCFIALQTNDPIPVMVHLRERIALENVASTLCECSPRQFCEWVGVDAAVVSKSLRERDTPLSDHPWMRLFDHYFDDFEQLTIDERLDLLMGVRGADTYHIFKPTFTVYPDGEMELSRRTTSDLEEEVKHAWIDITRDLVDKIELLAA